MNPIVKVRRTKLPILATAELIDEPVLFLNGLPYTWSELDPSDPLAALCVDTKLRFQIGTNEKSGDLIISAHHSVRIGGAVNANQTVQQGGGFRMCPLTPWTPGFFQEIRLNEFDMDEYLLRGSSFESIDLNVMGTNTTLKGVGF